MTTNPMYINRVKQMSDMSYTLEQFDQDKQTLLNLIADCEELEKSFFVFGKLFHCVTHVVHLFDSVNIHGIDGLWEISGQ